MRPRSPRALTVRTVTVTGLGVALTAALASCSDAVSKDTVAGTISSELAKQNLTADAVSCPGDLQAEVGQSMHCGFTVDGQPVDAIATVTSVDGGKARLAITTDARPIAKDLLARKVGEQVARKSRVPVERSSCAGDLAPTVKATQRCDIVSKGADVPVTVTVTKVDGGLITYSVQQV